MKPLMQCRRTSPIEHLEFFSSNTLNKKNKGTLRGDCFRGSLSHLDDEQAANKHFWIGGKGKKLYRYLFSKRHKNDNAWKNEIDMWLGKINRQ